MLEKYKTDETKGLTTSELQRLVLLEQLKTARIQNRYFKEKVERMEPKNSHQIQNITTDGASSYFSI